MKLIWNCLDWILKSFCQPKGPKGFFLVRQNTILVLQHSLTNISLNSMFDLVLYHGLQKKMKVTIITWYLLVGGWLDWQTMECQRLALCQIRSQTNNYFKPFIIIVIIVVVVKAPSVVKWIKFRTHQLPLQWVFNVILEGIHIHSIRVFYICTLYILLYIL